MNYSRDGKNDKDKRVDYDTYILNASSGLYEPESCTRQDQTNRKVSGTTEKTPFFTHNLRDWLTIIISALGLIVSSLTLLLLWKTVEYARLQWNEAKRTADASVEAAKAAKSAAHTAAATLVQSDRSFLIEQRPYVVVEFPEFSGNTPGPGVELFVNVHYRNLGKTPAINVVQSFDLLSFRGGGQGKEGTSKYEQLSTTRMHL